MKIAVYGRTFDQSFIPYIDKFLNCLEENSVEVIFYKPFYEFAKGDNDFHPSNSNKCIVNVTWTAIK